MMSKIQDSQNIKSLSLEVMQRMIQKADPNELGATLHRARWFRSKDKTIQNLRFKDTAGIHSAGLEYLLSVLEVRYENSEPELYFVPMIAHEEPFKGDERALLFHFAEGGKNFFFLDALYDENFRGWLSGVLAREETVFFEEGSIKGRTTERISGKEIPESGNFRLLGAEQSNTSFVIQEEKICKCIRKLELGISPEVEMLEVLKNRGFPFAPKLLGDITYCHKVGLKSTLAVMQNFVGAVGDGWSYALSAVAHTPDDYFKTIEDLGRVTARMHSALAAPGQGEAFKPEPVTPEDIKKWKGHYLSLLRSAFRSIERKGQSAGCDEKLYKALLSYEEELKTCDSWLKPEDSDDPFSKIRVHGDYHLGQTALKNGEWILFDFEGEPMLDIEDRKKKHCALKDVAGMLRSFHYAASVASVNKTEKEKETICFFEQKSRELFLKGYFWELEKTPAMFLYSHTSNNERLLRFFELDKAVYELNYELNNRPDWVFVPVEGIIRLLNGK